MQKNDPKELASTTAATLSPETTSASKLKKTVLILITILIISIIGIGTYLVASKNQHNDQTKQKATSQEQNSSITEISDWKTYDTTLFSFKYPSSMSVNASSSRNNVMYRGPTEEKSKEYFFGLHKLDPKTETASQISTISIDGKPAWLRKIVNDARNAYTPKNAPPVINTTSFVIENVALYSKGKWIENGRLFFNIYIDGDSKKAESVANAILSTIKFKDLKSQNSTLGIHNIELQIPNTWWYQYGRNTTFNNEWFDIDTKSNGNPYPDKIPDFTIEYNPNTSTEEATLLEQNNKSKYYEWIKEQNITVDGVPGKRIEMKRNNEIVYNSRYKPNDIVTYVIASRNKETYSLSGTTTTPELRKNFDQILSTIQFKKEIDATYIPQYEVLHNGDVKVKSLYGYTVQIPKGWSIQNDYSNNAEFRITTCPKAEGSMIAPTASNTPSCLENIRYMIFSVPKENKENLDVEQWLKNKNVTTLNEFGENIPSSKKIISINDRKAVLFTPSSTENTRIFGLAYIPMNHHIIAISYYISGQRSFQKQFESDDFFTKILTTIHITP